MNIYCWYKSYNKGYQIGIIKEVKETTLQYRFSNGAGDEVYVYGSQLSKQDNHVGRTFIECKKKLLKYLFDEIEQIQNKLAQIKLDYSKAGALFEVQNDTE